LIRDYFVGGIETGAIDHRKWVESRAVLLAQLQYQHLQVRVDPAGGAPIFGNQSRSDRSSIGSTRTSNRDPKPKETMTDSESRTIEVELCDMETV
jgi:hypothetical protein